MAEVYTTDLFIKYRESNKTLPDVFNKYLLANNVNSKKVQSHTDIFDRPDLRTKLNHILTHKNTSNEDDNLHRNILKTLNEVNNDSTNSFNLALNTLTKIKFSKIEHFEKLADTILDKAINEHLFSSIYAKLCVAMSQYYIESNGKKINFRPVLISKCQSMFDNYNKNCEKMDRSRFVGVMKIIAELYNNGLFPFQIIKSCFNELSVNVNKSYNVAEGISELIITTYDKMIDEFFNTKNKDLANCLEQTKIKFEKMLNDKSLPIKSKFAIQNAVDKMNK